MASSNYSPNVTQEQLSAIKADFFAKFQSKIDKNEYHEKDLERLKKDNEWMLAFYKHGLEDHQKTLTVIDESLSWRKQFGANDLLTPGKLPFDQQILDKGYIFYRHLDKKGQKLLHFRAKLYKKNTFPSEQIHKLIAYFLEKEYTFSVKKQIVFLFDLSDSGISNTDLDMTKFVLFLVKTYYAGLVDYVIVFDMPLIFQAIWKAVKLLLPAQAIELVKFVDKKTIREYVDENQLFIHMGGKEKFAYDSKDPDLYCSEANLNI